MNKAPFPFYGSKTKISNIIWRFLGNPKTYIEPFFGSGAVFLQRPNIDDSNIEIINDKDGHITNVWRALKLNPDSIIEWCEWPISHIDLSARKIYLLNHKNELEEKLRKDPEYYDSKLAGYWIWYACTSICCDMTSVGSIPNLMSNTGIHKKAARSTNYLKNWFNFLSNRLRFVKIVCSDWIKVCGKWLDNEKSVGIFLDPPYLATEKTYYTLSRNVSEDVRKYCIEKGKNPNYKIILCGLDEHQELLDYGWTTHNWNAKGWFSKNNNRFKETIYLSPNCKNNQSIL